MRFQKRELTPSMITLIKSRTNDGYGKPYNTLLLLAVIVPPSIIYYFFIKDDLLRSTAELMGKFIIGYIILLFILFLIQIWIRQKKKRSYEIVLKFGEYKKIEVIENTSDGSAHKNNKPKQRIKFTYNREEFKIITFDLQYANYFKPGTIEALVHPEAPGIAIPKNSWSIYEEEGSSINDIFSK